MDADYAGPTPSFDEPSGRYRPTKEFVEGVIQLFKDGGKLPKRLCWEIVLGCKDAVESELSLVETVVEKGVVCDVVGDTHGVSVRASSGPRDDGCLITFADVLQQFFDLCNLLSMIGAPSDDHMIVFNGDFVDRGSWSVEVVLTLFAYKWLYPNRVYLNRGNHETSGTFSWTAASWLRHVTDGSLIKWALPS
jgi:serine/threonine-protein phosphatase 5